MLLLSSKWSTWLRQRILLLARQYQSYWLLANKLTAKLTHLLTKSTQFDRQYLSFIEYPRNGYTNLNNYTPYTIVHMHQLHWATEQEERVTMVYPCLSLYCTRSYTSSSLWHKLLVSIPITLGIWHTVTQKIFLSFSTDQTLLSLDKYITSNFTNKPKICLISPYLYSVLTTYNEKLLFSWPAIQGTFFGQWFISCPTYSWLVISLRENQI